MPPKFDMQKARDLAANPIHCKETDEIFRAALDEIGRQNKDSADYETDLREALESAGIPMGNGENPQDVLTAIELLANRCEAQAKHIAELEAKIDLRPGGCDLYEKKHKAILKLGAKCRELKEDNQKLEAALVEERAKVLYFAHAGDGMYDMDVLEEADHHKTRHLQEADEQLRREGLL